MKSKFWAIGIACLLLFCLAPASALAGSVSGTVTDAGTGLPLGEGFVCAQPEEGSGICEAVEESGDYELAEVPEGVYRIEFTGPFGSNYVSQYWQDAYSWTDATAIDLEEEESRIGINAALLQGAEIEGSIVGAGGAGPIYAARACAELVSGQHGLHCGLTNEAGEYSIAGLLPGAYEMIFLGPYSGPGYASRYYDEKALPGESEELTLAAGQSVIVSATLELAGTIEGTLTAEGAVPSEGDVCLLELDGTAIECTSIDGAGHYSFAVATGSYILEFDSSEYTTQYSGGTTERADATPVEGISGQITTDSADLYAPPGIAGVVTDEETGEGIEEGEACAIGPVIRTCTALGEEGHFTIPVGAGTYTVLFKSPEHVTQFWQEAATEADATPVVVSDRLVSGISAELEPAGVLEGHLISAASLISLEGVHVCAFGTGGFEECAFTESTGLYKMADLPAGEYTVSFGLYGFVTQYYEDKETAAEATPVTIQARQHTTADATLTEEVSPSDVTSPEVSGVGKVGEILSCTEGTWTGTPAAFTYGYTWYRGGGKIGGAKSSTYTLVSADAGSSIDCGVAATNTAGTASIVRSANSIAVAALPVAPSGSGGAAEVSTPPATATPTPPAPVVKPTPKKPLQCKKGFRKEKRKGKARCVKVKAKKGGKAKGKPGRG